MPGARSRKRRRSLSVSSDDDVPPTRVSARQVDRREAAAKMQPEMQPQVCAVAASQGRGSLDVSG